MEEKKVATSIDILINVGQFEHIQITKYAEKKITYESSDEMIKKEDEVTSELVSDIIRTMRGLPEKLGKKTNAISAIEEKIQKKIPEWLANNPVPNLAKDKFELAQAAVSSKVEAKKEKEERANAEVANLIDPPAEKPKEEEMFSKDVPEKTIDFDSEDLFK